MRLLISWLREFVDVEASPAEIADTLGLRGFEVAAIEPMADGDAVIDFEITANRPDCLSVVGLAREVATAYDVPWRRPSSDPDARVALARVPVGESDRLRVTIEDPELCPRYVAATADLAPAVSPAWMTDRLKAAGIRPISPIVDITNYVLVELGHPMHAFDLAKLAGPEIRVRRARPGEAITTLDGAVRTLDPDMLAIADAGRPQAIAGVMGGSASEVSASTTQVALESACFNPPSVRRTSKRLGLSTEASFRFERGADIEAPLVAIERAVALMKEVGAGHLHGPVVDRYPRRWQPVRIRLRRERLARLLGIAVPDADVDRILRSLGLDVRADADGWQVAAPAYRVDLVREVDLIEEVGRHVGFDRLPDTFPALTQPAGPPDPRIARDRLVRSVLCSAGLSEAVTFGFLEASAAEPFAAGAPVVAVANPLSAKFDTLRPSLLPGLVDAIAHNRRHGRADVALFEIGARFSPRGETRAMALAWTGAATPRHWSHPARDVDFFDVKGVVEQVCRALEVDATFEAAGLPWFVAGQTASVLAAGAAVGCLGRLTPSVLERRGVPRQDQDPVFAAELSLDALSAARVAGDDAVRALPRHPSVVRDVSIVVDDALPAAIIRGTIQAAGAGAPAPLAGLDVFDRYRGEGVPEGRVSLSLRLTFQAADRTLTDAEVQPSVDAILAALVSRHGAVQR